MRKKTLILSALAAFVLFGGLVVLLMPQHHANTMSDAMPESITLTPDDRAVIAQGRLVYQGNARHAMVITSKGRLAGAIN